MKIIIFIELIIVLMACSQPFSTNSSAQKKDSVVNDRQIINNFSNTNIETNTTYNQQKTTRADVTNIDNSCTCFSTYTENIKVYNETNYSQNNTKISVTQDNSTNTRVNQQQQYSQNNN